MTTERYLYKLVKIDPLAIYISSSTYHANEEIINQYATSASTYNLTEDNNDRITENENNEGAWQERNFVEVVITSPNLCELFQTLGSKLDICSFGKFHVYLDDTYGSFSLIEDIIRYDITHKLQLIQIIIDINKDKKYDPYVFDITDAFFKYPDNTDIWMALPMIYCRDETEYLVLCENMFKYSYDDSLLEALIFFSDRFTKIARKSWRPYAYYLTIGHSVLDLIHHCNHRMLNVYFATFHTYVGLGIGCLISAFEREQYEDIDNMLKYYPGFEIRFKNDLLIQNELFIITSLQPKHISYFVSLICDAKINICLDSAYDICYRCIILDNQQLFEIILEFYPLIANDITEDKVKEKYATIDQELYNDLSTKCDRYNRYALKWKIANEELMKELEQKN